MTWLVITLPERAHLHHHGSGVSEREGPAFSAAWHICALPVHTPTHVHAHEERVLLCICVVKYT